jgi:transposase
MGVDELEPMADRGYFKGEEVLACEEARITVYVPHTITSNSKAKGLYDKADLRYIAQDDQDQCPADERLPHRMKSVESGKLVSRYWSSNCRSCALKPKCTPGKERRVSRWQREDVLDAMHARMDRRPEMMRLRHDTVEHPFGTLNRWMGAEPFLMKGLRNVGTEMSLQVLCCHLKWVMNILGVKGLVEAPYALFY